MLAREAFSFFLRVRRDALPSIRNPVTRQPKFGRLGKTVWTAELRSFVLFFYLYQGDWKRRTNVNVQGPGPPLGWESCKLADRIGCGSTPSEENPATTEAREKWPLWAISWQARCQGDEMTVTFHFSRRSKGIGRVFTVSFYSDEPKGWHWYGLRGGHLSHFTEDSNVGGFWESGICIEASYFVYPGCKASIPTIFPPLFCPYNQQHKLILSHPILSNQISIGCSSNTDAGLSYQFSLPVSMRSPKPLKKRSSRLWFGGWCPPSLTNQCNNKLGDINQPHAKPISAAAVAEIAPGSRNLCPESWDIWRARRRSGEPLVLLVASFWVYSEFNCNVAVPSDTVRRFFPFNWSNDFMNLHSMTSVLLNKIFGELSFIAKFPEYWTCYKTTVSSWF